MADLSGRVLGGFVLLEQIGKGGFGKVYRCEQPVLKRFAVIEVLHEPQSDEVSQERSCVRRSSPRGSIIRSRRTSMTSGSSSRMGCAGSRWNWSTGSRSIA